MNGKTRLWFVGVAGSLILATAWSFLATPGTALAKKGGGGNKPVALHGCIGFHDRDFDGDGLVDDRVQSDGGG